MDYTDAMMGIELLCSAHNIWRRTIVLQVEKIKALIVKTNIVNFSYFEISIGMGN